TAPLSLDQAMLRPDSGLPLASFGVAASCNVCPTATLPDGGLTVTDATGLLVTVTLEAPLSPPLVAVLVADPGATPLTSPLPSTAATAALLLDQLIVQPDSTLPPVSRDRKSVV